MSHRIWLLKTEPRHFSIDDLAASPQCTTGWDGVRNFQARNRIRDEMQVADIALIYHSSCSRPAIVGEARIISTPYPDPSQFLPDHVGYDARSTRQQPRWYQVDVQLHQPYSRPLYLKQIKQHPEFADMELLVRPRLSVQKLTQRQYQLITGLHQSMDVSA